MRRVSSKLNTLLEPIVTGLGFEYVGSEYGQTDSGQTLRVYIDKPDGIDVDHCALVSRQVSAMLDVEDPIADAAYYLEVSSPGVDRPLFTRDQYAQFVGEDARIRTAVGVDGRRNFRGQIEAVTADTVVIVVDKQAFELPVVDIERAYLIGKL